MYKSLQMVLYVIVITIPTRVLLEIMDTPSIGTAWSIGWIGGVICVSIINTINRT